MTLEDQQKLQYAQQQYAQQLLQQQEQYRHLYYPNSTPDKSLAPEQNGYSYTGDEATLASTSVAPLTSNPDPDNTTIDPSTTTTTTTTTTSIPSTEQEGINNVQEMDQSESNRSNSTVESSPENTEDPMNGTA